MSIRNLRAALEVALNSISPSLATAFENVPFTPEQGTAYQRVNLLRAEPENPSIGASLTRSIGILQVTLCYPLGNGPQPAEDRAQAIVDAFARGASFTRGGVTVRITTTPTVGPAYVEADRYCVPVSIRYHCNEFA